MKLILNEKQLNKYKKYLLEGRSLSAGQRKIIDPAVKQMAQDIYGAEYGTKDEKNSKLYDVEVVNDAMFPSGLFSIGNQKLSDDTLIINFTSALGCPSLKLCPVTQKACYAVAGENRLPDTRRKNIMVQNLWRKAMINAAKENGSVTSIDKIFNIAELYIKTLSKTKKPIRYIRFNEVGDFPKQNVLVGAARFAKKMKEEYNVLSMAYTANKALKFTEEVDGTPIDKIIKINASRLDIKLSDDNVNQTFLATEMDYKTVLSNADNVEEISDLEANKLKCKTPVTGKYGIKSVPQLSYGKWTGGEGWYYVCPCSFWKYNKDKAESMFYNNIGYTDRDLSNDKKERLAIRKSLPEDVLKQLNSILNKIKSPCGRECAVCHDIEGGITPTGEIVNNYTVLTATHGPNSSNFDPEYAYKKRIGKDKEAIYKNDEKNPYGLWTKYGSASNNDDNEL